MGLAGAGVRSSQAAADTIRAFPVPPGLVGDGIADDGPAIRAAVDRGQPVFLPPGRFNVGTGTLSLAPGQIFAGAGSSATKLLIKRPGAQAVLSMQEKAPGADIRDICISFGIGDTRDLAQIPEFPVAVRAVDAPRFKLTRLRVEGGRIGIDMQGNSGGATMSDIELGCTQAGIIIDGSLDSVKINNFHIWPFGFSRAQIPMFTTDYNIGIKCGRCDDIQLNGGMIFGLRNAAVFSRTPRGRPFGSIVGVDFDHRGGLVIVDGDIRVAGSTFTIGNPDSQWLRANNGIINMAGCHFSGSRDLNGPGVLVDGPSFFTLSSASFTSGYGDYSLLTIRNGAKVAASALTIQKFRGKKYINPAFSVSAQAVLSVSGIVASDLDDGSATLLKADISDNVSISGFIGKGWTR